MSPLKVFQDTDLREIHNTEIDYPIPSPKSCLYSPTQYDENSKMAGKTEITVHNYTIKKKTIPLKPYGWSEFAQALCVELLVCIINQVFLHMAPSTAGFWAGHLMLILIIYPVSGANMNAVMSLALWIYEEEFTLIHTIRRWSYILVIQPLGIFLGQMLCLGLVTDNLKYINDKSVNPERIMFTELLGTFFIIFSALHFIVSKYTRPSTELGIQFIFFGLAVFFTIEAGKSIDSGSGGAYNLTFYVISNAIAKHRGYDDVFTHWYCYVFPQIVGSLGATFLFKYYYEATYYRIYMLKLKWEQTFFPKKYE